MIIEFFILGKVYPARVRRVKGKLKLFFSTDSEFHNIHGFDLPCYCCGNIKHRWRSLSQKKIAFELQKKEFKPNSLSSIEKYLKALREEYGASTLFHLACLMIKSGELIIDDL